MKRCPVCGKFSLTTGALLFHIGYAHHGVTEPQAPATPRLCIICEGKTRGADALCAACQRLPQDEIQTALHGLVELGEINDFDTPLCSYAEHMTDTNEPPRTHWYAVVSALVAYHGFMLDDSGRE